MSERQKWMPSDQELYRFHSLQHSEHLKADAIKLHHRTGLRAQIAVLQELLGKSEWIPVAYGAEDETKMIEVSELEAKIQTLQEELKNGM